MQLSHYTVLRYDHASHMRTAMTTCSEVMRKISHNRGKQLTVNTESRPHDAASNKGCHHATKPATRVSLAAMTKLSQVCQGRFEWTGLDSELWPLHCHASVNRINLTHNGNFFECQNRFLSYTGLGIRRLIFVQCPNQGTFEDSFFNNLENMSSLPFVTNIKKHNFAKLGCYSKRSTFM